MSRLRQHVRPSHAFRTSVDVENARADERSMDVPDQTRRPALRRLTSATRPVASTLDLAAGPRYLGVEHACGHSGCGMELLGRSLSTDTRCNSYEGGREERR
jgi:hypothetical protein